MRRPLDEIRELLRAAAEREEETARSLTGATNRQAIEVQLQATARAGAFRAALAALNGDTVTLRIYAQPAAPVAA